MRKANKIELSCGGGCPEGKRTRIKNKPGAQGSGFGFERRSKVAADDVFSAKGVKKLCRQIAARLRCRVPKPESNAEHGSGLAKEEQRNERTLTFFAKGIKRQSKRYAACSDVAEGKGFYLPCGAGRLGLKYATGTFPRALGFESSKHLEKCTAPPYGGTVHFWRRVRDSTCPAGQAASG